LDQTRLALGLARPTETRWAGVQTLPDVPATIDRLLRAVAEGGAFRGLRLREIEDDGLAQLLGALRLQPPEAPPQRLQAPHAGVVATDSQFAIFLVPPYGRSTSEALGRAAAWSEEFGTGEIRLSPFRALVIPFVNASAKAGLAALAGETGFIVDPGDPRLSVSTCAGKQGCGRGSTLTHADSDRLAAALPAGVSLHVSGCRKGCAHPAPADLTLVGDEGSYQVVLGGSARDKPLVRAGIDDIVDRLARVSNGKDLMRVFGAGRP
jgi:precorrin-3B synthase